VTRIDLQQFCSKDATRFYIMKPWSRGPFTYATNGHICVRVDAVGGDEERSEAPNADVVLSRHPDPHFAPLRVKLPDTPRKTCEICSGTGIWFDHPTKGIHETCKNCDGEKTLEIMQSVLIGGVPFASKCINQIAALPGAEFPVNPLPVEKDYRKQLPTPFRFTGGIGALMPMRSEGDVHLGDLGGYRVTM